MADARPFSISTLQDLSNDTKNTPNARCFGPCCRTLNIRESRRTPNPQLFQVLGFTPTLGQVRVATIIVVAEHLKCCCYYCDYFGNRLRKKYVGKMSSIKMSYFQRVVNVPHP